MLRPKSSKTRIRSALDGHRRLPDTRDAVATMRRGGAYSEDSSEGSTGPQSNEAPTLSELATTPLFRAAARAANRRTQRPGKGVPARGGQERRTSPLLRVSSKNPQNSGRGVYELDPEVDEAIHDDEQENTYKVSAVDRSVQRKRRRDGSYVVTEAPLEDALERDFAAEFGIIGTRSFFCWDFTAGWCKNGDRCEYLHNERRPSMISRPESDTNNLGPLSEAGCRLRDLLVEAGVGRTGVGDAEHAQGKDIDEWRRRCSLRKIASRRHENSGGSSELVALRMQMAGLDLDDEKLLAWAHWMDSTLSATAPGANVVFVSCDINFSRNALGADGAKALCALLEKHAVRCHALRLDRNRLCDEALREVVRYLVAFPEAPVRALWLFENIFSDKGISWLLANLSMHPAYPIWDSHCNQYIPLRVVLEPAKPPIAKRASNWKLRKMLEGTCRHCNISIRSSRSSLELPHGEKKHNCIVELCVREQLEVEVEQASATRCVDPHTKPIFQKTERSRQTTSGVRSSPYVLRDSDHIVVVYKPPDWVCDFEVDPVLIRLSDEERQRRMEHMLIQQSSASISTWIVCYFSGDPKATAVRDVKRGHGLCHRLDLDTSGPIVMAKSARGFDYAKQLLYDRDVVRDYVALVHGNVKATRGDCRAPIDKSPYAATRKVRIHKSGLPAVTLWESIAHYESESSPPKRYTLLHLRIISGRTHQIRVHLSHLGHPIVGDWKYGDRCGRDNALCPRLFLHKHRVSFVDMWGYAESVSCSLQSAEDLWASLHRLKQVQDPVNEFVRRCGAHA